MLSNLLLIIFLLFLELQSTYFVPFIKTTCLSKSFSAFSPIIGTKESRTLLVSCFFYFNHTATLDVSIRDWEKGKVGDLWYLVLDALTRNTLHGMLYSFMLFVAICFVWRLQTFFQRQQYLRHFAVAIQLVFFT